METVFCNVCQTAYARTSDEVRYGEFDNHPETNAPIWVCKPCTNQGYHLQYGHIRVYPGSPADAIGCPYAHVQGQDARFNPFADMSTWPKSTRSAGRARSYALRGYYRNKRR